MLKLIEKHNVAKYLAAAILLMIPLYPKFPLISIPGTFVSVRMEDFLLLMAGVFVFFAYAKHLNKVFSDRIFKSFFIYLAVGLVSLLYAAYVTKTAELHIGLLHWVRRIEYFIPFFVGIIALKDKRNLDFYLKVILVVILVAFIYGFGQKNFNWPMIVTQNLEYSKGIALRYTQGGHLNSTFAGHYDLSTFLVLVLPVFVCLFAMLKKEDTFLTKAMLFAAILTGVWLIAFSGSRISVVSYLISITAALVFIGKPKTIPFIVVLSLLIFSFSPSLMARYERIYEVTKKALTKTGMIFIEGSVPKSVFAQGETDIILKRRILPSPTPTPIPRFEDRSANIRLDVEWPRAIRAFSKNPLLGTGYSSITLATDNDYLRLLGEVGTLGTITFVLIFYRTGKVFVKSFPLKKKYSGTSLAFVGGLSGSFFGVLVNAFFIDVFEASKFATMFWLLAGMALCVINSKDYEKYN